MSTRKYLIEAHRKSGERFFAMKTGITRLYVVVDCETGETVTSTGTFNSAQRRADALNAKEASK